MSFRSLSLVQAVSARDQGAVKVLLSEGADVDARNSSGQTPLILAIVSGQDHFLRLLLDAGADPFLRDHTELNAIDWAERKGRSDLAQILRTTKRRDPSNTKLSEKLSRGENESPSPLDELRKVTLLSSDDKSRKWLSGIKRRFEEQADSETTKDHSTATQPNIMGSSRSNRVVANEVSPELSTEENVTNEHRREIAKEPRSTKETVPEPVSQTVLASSTAPQPEVQQPAKHPSKPSSNRKRCPECNTLYNSELLAYCAYHVVALVDADDPIITPRSKSSAALLWTLVLITLSLAGVLGLFLSGYLYKNNVRPSSATPPVTTTRQGIPVLGSTLVGKSVNLPAAEITVQTPPEPATITVQVKIDQRGRVVIASSAEGDQLLRESAIEAARRSTFSVQKLRGRPAEGTITYTFSR